VPRFQRQFYDIAKVSNAPIASEALIRIASLRDRGRDQGAKRRGAPQSPADAIAYGLSHWTGLIRSFDEGPIEIDSNTVERSMRPNALSRKNALFASSDEGAQNWAAIASLIETTKLNGVSPHVWLADTLIRLVDRWPASRID
jgi:hypothetical protein